MRTTLKLTIALFMAFVGASVNAQDADSASDIHVADPNAPVEVIEERFDDGRVKVRREVTLDTEGNYIKHGVWKSFSITEDEVASGNFKNNHRDGVWTKTLNWGDAGILNELPYTEFEAPFISKAEFQEGDLHGTWAIVDAQGRTASEWQYKEGMLDGKAKWFYPDGKLREEINYTDGLIDGSYVLWDQDGNEQTNEDYQQGRKLAVKQDLYPSGVVKWEGMFLHETYTIKNPDNWWESKPVTYEKAGKPERHGRFTSWYENGQKKFEGMFENEIRDGEFTWWHENTQKAVQGSFVNDERHGLWSWWHENGQKAIQGQYDNGKLDGKWSYWNADGKLERKMDYTGDSEPVAVHAIPSTAIPVVADQRGVVSDVEVQK